MTRHAELVREILLAANRLPGVFLFPVDVARVRGWKRTLGMKGTSDILGWKETAYGQAAQAGMWRSPRFVALEIKVGRDRLHPEQRAFLEKVKLAGGIALEVRDVMTVIEALR